MTLSTKELEELRVSLLSIHGVQTEMLGGELIPCTDCREYDKKVLELIQTSNKEARIDEIERYDHMSYHSREEHEEYMQARVKQLKQEEAK